MGKMCTTRIKSVVGLHISQIEEKRAGAASKSEVILARRDSEVTHGKLSLCGLSSRNNFART